MSTQKIDGKRVSELVAQKVMLWTPTVSAVAPRGSPNDAWNMGGTGPGWHTVSMSDWRPVRDPAQGVSVLEVMRMAPERFGEVIIRPSTAGYTVTARTGTDSEVAASAANLGLAVCVAALRALGLMPES